MLSTSDLSTMPEIEDLRKHMQCLAAVNAIFSIEFGETQFSFAPLWRKDEQVAVDRNGSGDEVYMHFTQSGCFIKGFAHESEMTPHKRPDHGIWPGVPDSVPPDFSSSIVEPAFDLDSTTFVIWRLATDTKWSTGEIEFPAGDYKDGSADLLKPAAFSAADFTEWLADNFETDVDGDIIEAVFDGKPLSDVDILKLNPTSSIEDIRDAVRATGYQS